MVNWCNWDCSSCSRVLSVSRVWGSREEQAIRIGRSWWKPRIQNKAMATQSYLRELFIFRVPENKIQVALGQHRCGAEGLWAAGCLIWRGVRSVRGKSEVVWRALPPPASAIWWCDQGGLRWDESVFSICIPEASRL